MINILIAEDHQMVREGLRGLLEKEEDFVIAAEATTGQEAVDKAREFKPDVLLLDLTLPGLHGLHVLGELGRRKQLRIVVLTMHRDDASVLEALRLGARAYVIKDAPASDLTEAIRSAMRNELFVSEALRPLVQRAASEALNGAPAGKACLTRQEMVVLKLASESKKSQEIAQELGISPRTVEKHRANLMQKLGLRSQGELVRYAIRHRIVPA